MIARVALLALLAVLAACGKDEAPEPDPGAVVKRYYAAGKDPSARCGTLSTRSLARFGGRDGCAERNIPSPDAPPETRIETVRRSGDTACVRYQLEPGGKGIITLVREGAGWKIDRFDSGLEPSQATALPCAMKPRDVPE